VKQNSSMGISRQNYHQILQNDKKDSSTLFLYFFFLDCVQKQKTKTIKITSAQCKRELKWGEKKFKKAKNVLLELKIIEQVNKKQVKVNNNK